MTLTQSLAAAQADYAQTKERAMEQLRDGKISLSEASAIFFEAEAKRTAARGAALWAAFREIGKPELS